MSTRISLALSTFLAIDLEPMKSNQESPDLSSALSQCKSRGERSGLQTRTDTTVCRTVDIAVSDIENRHHL